ncbi:MAG: 16S rRNA (uracil1498-N3)-methyltransferase [Granulosicoccus sp.]|jgi:16S rRNA (uracil1498-N3)-methyltransferase
MKKTSRSARTPRFFHDGELHAHTELELSKKASHHLVTVMRTKEKDCIELFNGDGNNYTAVVTSSGQRTPGKRAQLTIDACIKANTESPLSLIFVQAISRGDRMDACLRQSVELGVTHIQPIYSRHSAKPLDEQRTEKKITHWNNIIISACEQSGRATLPVLEAPVGLTHWLENVASERGMTNSELSSQRIDYILSPHAENTLAAHLSAQTHIPSSCALVIGPESGFDEDEVDAAIATGVQSVQLGNRILRTETAGPACIAVMQAMLGDLRQV